jgi:hypothetical protein
MPTQTSTVVLAATLVLGIASASSAQQAPPPFKAKPPAPGLQPATQTTTPTYDITYGYQLLHVPDTWFPFGLNVDAARNFGALSLVGEVGWAFKSEDDVSNHVWHFGAGPRVTLRNSGKVWPFAQAIVGAAHLRFSADDFSDSTTKFMVQPGGGVVVVAGDGWGIVGQVDYRRIFLDEDEDGESGENDFRILFGVRLILD